MHILVRNAQKSCAKAVKILLKYVLLKSEKCGIIFKHLNYRRASRRELVPLRLINADIKGDSPLVRKSSV